MDIRLKEDKGFTLLEVIIAISILTFGILAVGAMQGAALRGDSLAYSRTSISTIEQDLVEGLMAVPYANMPPDGSYTRTVGSYTINWTVTTDPAAYRTIDVTVTYLGLAQIQTARLRVTRSQLFD